MTRFHATRIGLIAATLAAAALPGFAAAAPAPKGDKSIFEDPRAKPPAERPPAAKPPAAPAKADDAPPDKPGPAAKAPANAAPANAAAPKAGKKLVGTVTVAILDFDTGGKGNAELGKQIPDALAAMLSDVQGLQLVERSEISRVLQEQAANLTGLVDADKAVKVGKIMGAQLLITGKVFPLDNQTYVTAKIIGAETSAVKAVMVKGNADRDVGKLLVAISDKIGKTVQQNAGDLLPAGVALDPLPALKQRLAGKQKPTVAISISEQHRSSRANIDPAVETEVRKMMIECGFDVAGDAEKAKKADVTISGEALSEFGALIGNLTACSARVEVKAVDQKTSKVVFTDRTTVRAADLSEAIAGKAALQRGGRDIAIRLLTQLADTLPNKP